YAATDIIPDVVTVEYGTMSTVKRAELKQIMERLTREDDKAVIKTLMDETIVYDRVIAIEEVESSHPYVYDFTVKDTRNFNIYNGLAVADTFHMSGVGAASKAVRGVPRLRELLSITKNMKTPIMYIYLKDEYSQDKKRCLDLMNEVRTLRFKDIVSACRIYFDPDDFNTSIPEDASFIQSHREYQELGIDTQCDKKLSPWLLRLVFDPAKLLAANVTMIDIHHVLSNFYDANISCMFSDDNSSNLVMRIKLTLGDDDSSNNKDAEDGIDDGLMELKALEHNIMEVLMIKGIPNVEKVSLHEEKSQLYDDVMKQFATKQEWVIDTEGTNLRHVLSKSYVDGVRTISNDINEIYTTLGIEAARQALYTEIMEVLGSVAVNYRHLALLVDTMTNRGYLLSIDRHGINRGDIGPLAKCSFEEVNDMLIKAGVFSEVDKINGVSANIILGQIAPCGTGDSDILIDELKLSELGIQPKMGDLDSDSDSDAGDDELTLCDQLGFDFALPAIDTSIVKKEIRPMRLVEA
ncbi:MAG: hypothetical protein VKK05_08300, partial [Synechococcus sp.]|nr:hypothetical protein [Synechococcus sp.]